MPRTDRSGGRQIQLLLRWFLLLVWVVYGVVTVYFVYISTMIRPFADDFCTLSVVQNNGYFGTLYNYFGIRYSTSILSYFVALFTGQSFRFLVTLLLLSYISIAWFAAKLYFKKLTKLVIALAGLFSTVVFVTIFMLTPDKMESLYWFGASIVYSWSLPFFLLGVCLYIFVTGKTTKRAWPLATLFSLSLFSFGFNETFTLATLPFLGGLLLTSLLFYRKQVWAVTSAIAANLLAVIIMLKLPATYGRVQAYQSMGLAKKPSILPLLTASFSQAKSFLSLTFSSELNLVFMAATVVVVAVAVYFAFTNNLIKTLQNRWPILIVFASLITALWTSFLPSAYIFYPIAGPDRLEEVPVFVVTALLILLGYMIAVFVYDLELSGGKLSFQYWGVVILVACSISAAGGYIVRGVRLSSHLGIKSMIINDVSFYRGFAMGYDQREVYIEKLKSQGQEDIIVDKIVSNNYPGINFTTDKNHWINACAAKYYGVNSLLLSDK